MPAYWVLAAQIVVQACLTVATLALVTVTVVFFGIRLPGNPGAMILTLALCMAALFAIGLTIAAVALTAGAAGGLMAVALYPMLFFSGLYYPVQLMGRAIQDISRFTPLGAVGRATAPHTQSGRSLQFTRAVSQPGVYSRVAVKM